MLLTFIPIIIFAGSRIEPALLPWLTPVLLPLLVFDIQITNDDNWGLIGTWPKISWLSGVVSFAVLMYWFPPLEYSGSAGVIIGKTLVIAAFTIILAKMWIGDPLALFINRLRIYERQKISYDIITIEAKNRGRAFTYQLICRDKSAVEVSGFIYLYLLAKGLRKGGLITLNFKTGWLGVTFASGFPKISQFS